MNSFKDFLAVVLLGSFCLFSGPAPADPSAVDSQFCKDLIFDVNKIANARAAEVPKGALHNLVSHSPELSEERRSDINVMIEEAYSTEDQAALVEWMKKTVANCTI